MPWYNGAWGGPWGVFPLVMPIVMVVVMVSGLILVRWILWGGRPNGGCDGIPCPPMHGHSDSGRMATPSDHGTETTDPALEILRRRYASGEIDRDEYLRMRDTLRG